ncbi:MAG: aminodeoxychorismate/anthranilate synthase component II [Desulfobacteraceae bacterium]|nr:MAG: aminodeoxychorismate/anthranilate synthase component II [Desulfobacteraceae bacterium]
MILVIDNYDSFTYNLVQYIEGFGAETRVFRNDLVSIDEIEAISPDAVLLSPGPCSPNEAGVTVQVVQSLCSKIPILGVCLGHQAICHAFGGKVVRAERVMHGKTSRIRNDGAGLFKGMPDPFEAGRYHSLIVERESLPECLTITAETEEGEIMGIRHRDYPVEGIQFHPESILTPMGKRIIRNFLEMVERRNAKGKAHGA